MLALIPLLPFLGFLVNATNPKGIIFMLAVLPQFIDPTRPQFVQYAICAATLFFTESRALLPQVKGAWYRCKQAGIAAGSIPRERKHSTMARPVFVS